MLAPCELLLLMLMLLLLLLLLLLRLHRRLLVLLLLRLLLRLLVCLQLARIQKRSMLICEGGTTVSCVRFVHPQKDSREPVCLHCKGISRQVKGGSW